MTRKFLKILLSLIAAIFFLWLAFREVNLPELWQQIRNVKLTWIIPFVFIMSGSHYLRAERWMLLLSDLDRRPPRSTLFAGVMIGYMLNYVFPRLGEISRPVYVARQLKLSTGNLLGTIVLERTIDLVCLIIFLFLIAFYYVSDIQVISQIFGTEDWTLNIYIIIPVLIFIIFSGMWAAYRLLRNLEESERMENPFMKKLIAFIKMFWEGLISIKDVKNWPLFILYTFGIWTGYALMAYLPLRMLDIQSIYNLGVVEALVVTVISAVGISIPTPGGIGSYHLFIQQSMWLLYAVPLVTALTYATITHAVTMLLVFLTGGIVLWFDKYYTLKSKFVR